jgi:hypothetical protein
MVKSQGFTTRTVELELKDRKPIHLDVSLTTDSASVALDSDPPGARVILNGADSGTTPCTVEHVPAGDAFLKMELAGFAPVDQILKLRAGQKEEVRMVMKPLPAQLTVVTIPPGARVYVENQFRGASPVTITDAAPGTYRIRVEMDGREPTARTVELQRDQKLVEEFRLEGNLGILELVTEPAGVRVFVDGQPAGETTLPPGGSDKLSDALLLKSLTVGSRNVQLTKEGYASKEFTVEIQRDQTATRHEKLQRLFIPNYEVYTVGGVERGLLLGTDPDGSVRMEVRPGIVRVFRAKDIKAQRPLQ